MVCRDDDQAVTSLLREATPRHVRSGDGPRLGDYERSATPRRTPEPFLGKASKAPIFVIQRHDAGTLRPSAGAGRGACGWAVPKGLPLGRRAAPRRPRRGQIRSTTRPSRASSHRASTAPAPSRSGTAALRTAGGEARRLDVPPRRRAGRGRLDARAGRLDGKEQNWLLLRKDEAVAPRARFAAQLATPVEAAPTGPEWLFEPKWDGYRAIVTVAGGDATLTSRNGTDLTERFRRSPAPPGTRCARRKPSGRRGLRPRRGRRRALRGAPVGLGPSRADGLRPALAGWGAGARTAAARAPFSSRLIDPAVGRPRLAGVRGQALLEAARERQLEGVVAKRADAPYRPGRRTPEWQKVKLRAQDDLPIVGYTRGTGKRGSSAPSSSPAASRTACTGRRTSAPASPTASTGCSRPCGPSSGRPRPLVRTPRMPRVRAADLTWVEPAARGRGHLRRVDA